MTISVGLNMIASDPGCYSGSGISSPVIGLARSRGRDPRVLPTPGGHLKLAPAFNSPCRRSQTLRRDAALVSRPKGQATRPRVLLWVIRVGFAGQRRLPVYPRERTFSRYSASSPSYHTQNIHHHV